MRYQLVQGKVNCNDVVVPAIIKNFNKYETALKVFEKIKDNRSSYDLLKGEYVVTVIFGNEGICNLYKSYPTNRSFTL